MSAEEFLKQRTLESIAWNILGIRKALEEPKTLTSFCLRISVVTNIHAVEYNEFISKLKEIAKTYHLIFERYVISDTGIAGVVVSQYLTDTYTIADLSVLPKERYSLFFPELPEHLLELIDWYNLPVEQREKEYGDGAKLVVRVPYYDVRIRIIVVLDNNKITETALVKLKKILCLCVKYDLDNLPRITFELLRPM